jgi:transcription elongation factor GreA
MPSPRIGSPHAEGRITFDKTAFSAVFTYTHDTVQEDPMSRAPLTMKGAQRLRAELEQLKSVQRPAVINAIAEARAHGDLKENAEYHAAREQQGFIEGRIKQLEAELSQAQVIDISMLNVGSRVVFGATVTLADVETEDEKRYQIVGDLEADIKLGLIAISSPIARALIGKHEGDVVEIDAPAGRREYELIHVAYEG